MAKRAFLYLAGGILIGSFWYFNRAHPPLQEAIRTIAVFAAVLFFMRHRLARKSIQLHLLPLLATKATLVILAAIAQSILQARHAVAQPALLTAIGLGIGIAVFGTLGDRFFFSRRDTPDT